MSTLAEITTKFGFDPLSAATNDRLRWDDPGLDEFESGWELFPRGIRVEVVIRLGDDGKPVWKKGTVIEQFLDNERAIAVKCDEVVHDNLSYLDGRGVTIMVFHTEKRWLLSLIRHIDEPRQNIAKK